MVSQRYLPALPRTCSAGFSAQAAGHPSKDRCGFSDAAGDRTARPEKRLRRLDLDKQRQSEIRWRLPFSWEPGRGGANHRQMALNIVATSYGREARKAAIPAPRNRAGQGG